MKNDQKITKYGQVALKAVLLAADGTHPLKAWQAAAAEIFIGSPKAEIKGCPKSVFLGLAEAGLIKGIAPGKYTTSIDNKRYAETAVVLLQTDESWSQKPKELWSRVAETNGKKRHNSQIDVVLALWNAKQLVEKSA